MDDRSQELREYYDSLSTDELLAIRVGSIELTETANRLLDAELARRKVTSEDHGYARDAQAIIAADLNQRKEMVRGWVRKMTICVVLLASVAIFMTFCSEKIR